VTIRPILGAWEQRDRPSLGQTEDRNVPAESIRVEGRRVHGVIPYGVESRDLGGWREVIEPGALRNARLDDLVALVDHAGVPIGRHPSTLHVEDRSNGLHWSVELPESRSDVREAIERRDLQAGSWRMRVARDEWRGDVRHVHEIAELADVSIVTRPAYVLAGVELRSTNGAGGDDDHRGAERGGLHVDDRRSSSAPAGLAEAFRSRGFPGERAELSFAEYEARAVTWTGSLDSMAPVRRQGSPLPADSRWFWPALQRVGVDAGTTSVDVVRQSARALADPASMNRAIDAISPKPETSSTVEIVSVTLRQLAHVSSGIPNVYLESAAVVSIVEGDLRLGLNEAIDAMAVAAVAGSPFHAPAANLVISVREAITVLQDLGYSPDTLVLRPSDAEDLDTLVSGVAGADADFVFAPGAGAGGIWNLSRRIAKAAPSPIVLDSGAFGRLYGSPVSLARFEENDGKTNTSVLRLEAHGVLGVERADAAVRIAAS
jgi:HK97 family phage prohead protease